MSRPELTFALGLVLVLLGPAPTQAADRELLGVAGPDGLATDPAVVRAAARGLDLAASSMVPADLPSLSPGVRVLGGEVLPCAPVAGGLDVAIGAARAALFELDSEAALATLIEGVEAAPCSEPRPAVSQLLVALDLAAAAATDLGRPDRARELYRRALAVAPPWPGPALGSGYEELFSDAKRSLVAPVSVTLWQGPYAAPTWNGVTLEDGATLRMSPGRHLLEWSEGHRQARWIEVSTGGASVLVGPLSGPQLLVDAAADPRVGDRWSELLAEDGVDHVVVLAVEPRSGLLIGEGSVRSWTDIAPPARSTGRVRLAGGPGWSLVDGHHYLAASVVGDVRLVGPLWLSADGGLGFGRARLPGSELDGAMVLLPRVAAGLLLRPPGGPVRPFVAVRIGVSFGGGDRTRSAQEELARLGGSAADPDSGAVRPSLLAEGGGDLTVGRLLVRLWGAAGAGRGFEAGAGVRVGVAL